jgi:hypothetical protein
MATYGQDGTNAASTNRQAPPTGRAVPSRETPRYGGAVYGSLLAASVIVGTTPRVNPPAPAHLAVLLIASGALFWLAHCYAEVVGNQPRGGTEDRTPTREVARQEWPLLQSSFPPATAALVFAILGFSDRTAAWAALAVAVAGTVGWGALAASRSGASPLVITLSAVVNLGFGLVLVALQGTVLH